MKCEIVENKDLWSLSADRIDTFLKFKEIKTVAICGGRILKPLTAALIQKKVNISNINIYLTDERLSSVPSELNSIQIKNEFLDTLNNKQLVQNSFFHDPWKNGGFDFSMDVPAIDLSIISAGEDGHFAGFFPGSKLTEKGKYLKVENAPKPPSDRASLSAEMIARSKYIMLFFSGISKKDSFKKFLDLNYKFPEFPVAIFREHSRCIVFSDVEV